ncbi:MAG: zinc ribbon domain-containing protein [Chloroflexi bacterium]|nr:zinc ribbon domain-containing protein [Chloroflexota bacterium]
MAIYEYYCRSCDHGYEAMRPMSRAAEPFLCPECHAEAVRTISLFSAVVGGDGVALAPEGVCGMAAQGACACGAGACQAAL